VPRCPYDPDDPDPDNPPPPPGTKKGSARAKFRFSASDIDGATNIAAIHGAFSYNTAPFQPPATQGGPSSPGVCHFAYDPVMNQVFLDDANAGFTFPLSSVVGTGAIHAATSSSWKTVAPSQAQPQEYVVDVTLDVQLPTSPARKYHLYLYTQNAGGAFNIPDIVATRLIWTYYGYWWNVEQ
jgi:hypothetical protein